MMAIDVRSDFDEVRRMLATGDRNVRRAAREGLNRSAEWGATDVRRAMRSVFDRPVPFTLNSLRVYYASTANLQARLWFKQRGRDSDLRWAVAQIHGGERGLKAMETRLQRADLLPRGWMVVPGAAAPMDAHGNMSPGEISRILNVLGTYTEAGYNKANDKTRARLRKGTKKSYGFAYWVNPATTLRQRHLPPGVYRRVYTPFGATLKPMLIFVRRATYRARLPFESLVDGAVTQHFEPEFRRAWGELQAGRSPSAARRGKGAG